MIYVRRAATKVKGELLHRVKGHAISVNYL
jgi:hypothetical protein